MKKTVFVVTLVCLLLFLTACAAKAPNTPNIIDTKVKLPISYAVNNMTVTVSEVEPVDTSSTASAEWLSVSDLVFNDTCDLIVKAKVTDIREICIEYTKEITRRSYSSLIGLSIEEIYYSSSETKPDITTAIVNYEICSRLMFSDAVMLEEGEEYYLFLQNSSRANSPLGYDTFCDFIVRLPKTEDCILKVNMPMTNKIVMYLSQACDESMAKKALYDGADMNTALQMVFGGGVEE